MSSDRNLSEIQRGLKSFNENFFNEEELQATQRVPMKSKANVS